MHEQDAILLKRLTIAQINPYSWGGAADVGQNAIGFDVTAEAGQIGIVPDGQDVFVGEGVGVLLGVVPTNAKTIGVEEASGHFTGLVALDDE